MSHIPQPVAPPPRANKNDIVLLEEPERYQYLDDGYQDVKEPHVIWDPAATSTTVISNDAHTQSNRAGGSSYYQVLRQPGPYSISTKRSSGQTNPAYYGAYRPGGPVNLLSKQYVGLLLNWIIIGFLNGVMWSIVTPLFSNYLGYDGNRASAVSNLLNFAWFFKFTCGFITDCFPINRYRRKPYMFIGWTIYFGFMVAMACMREVEPYMRNEEILNAEAPSQGERYVIPLIVASFAHLLVTVACEGMMVEFSHREGQYERGRTLCKVVIARFVGETLGSLFITLGCNSVEYGGTFDASVPLTAIFAILAVSALLGVVVTHLYLKDELVPNSRQPLRTQLRHLWRFMEHPTTWRIMVVSFFVTMATSLYSPTSSGMTTTWIKVPDLTQKISSTIMNLSYIAAAFITSRWLLNTNWRTILAVSILGQVVVSLSVELLATFDVLREMVTWLIKDHIYYVLTSMIWLVNLAVDVEVAEPGYEATTYGFLTTVANLAMVIITTPTQVIAATIDPEVSNLADDTSEVRWHLAQELLITYGLRLLFVLAPLPLLPRQKRHIKEIKIGNNPNLMIPVLLFALFSVLFVAALTSSFLALFESTACLKFAGGSGCP